MRTFDYSFLKNHIPGQIVSISNVISDLNAKETIRRKQNPKAFDALKQRAIVESVKGSNAIEGIVTTDDRILDLVKGAVPVSHDEKEISGYKDALSMIHNGHRTMDLTEDFLLQMHRMITGAVSVEEAGKFKKNNNLIMEYTPDGKRRVRFRPVEAAETPDAIEQLILAYMDARQDGDITFRHARLSPIGTTEGFMKKLQKTNIVIDISRNIDIIEVMDKIEIFKALSNETRLNIMEWLKEPEKNFPPQGGHFDDVVDLKGGVCVGSIRDKAGVSQSTISHYLDILQKAGLLLSERHGKWTYYRRNEETLAALSEYFGHEI